MCVCVCVCRGRIVVIFRRARHFQMDGARCTSWRSEVSMAFSVTFVHIHIASSTNLSGTMKRTQPEDDGGNVLKSMQQRPRTTSTNVLF